MARRSSTTTSKRDPRVTGKALTPSGRAIGRPTSLTDRTEEVILGHLLNGSSIAAACALAGVHEATFRRWMRRGEDAQEFLDEHKTLHEDEERYRAFRESVLDARAQAETKAVGVVFKAMHGGFCTSEEPLLDLDGQPLRDDDGKILYKRTYTPPDGRLALASLQRARPADWNTRQTVDMAISGPDGGPVEVLHSVEQVQSLSERLLAVRQEFEQEEADEAAAAAADDDDVVEGEVVEG